MTSATVIVGYRDQGSPARRLSYQHVLDHLRRYDLVVTDPPGEPYSRAAAFNQGALQSRADVLVLHNPDVVIPPSQLDAAILLAELAGVTVYPFTRYHELTQVATVRYLAGSPTTDYQLVMGEECVGPALAVRRTVYEAWGGMDERFSGWGYEDVAWDVTSRTLVGPALRVGGACTHLWHPPALHSPHLPTRVTEENMLLCDRYRAADGDRDMILTLLAERDMLR